MDCSPRRWASNLWSLVHRVPVRQRKASSDLNRTHTYIQVCCSQSRVIVENQSVLTYLVFHHSLRIRLKSDALDPDAKNDKTKDKLKSTDESTTSSTPATADVDSAVSGETTEADSDTSASAADATPAPKGGHSQEKTGHIVGKINNLITSDLTAVGNLYLITTVREFLST